MNFELYKPEKYANKVTNLFSIRLSINIAQPPYVALVFLLRSDTSLIHKITEKEQNIRAVSRHCQLERFLQIPIAIPTRDEAKIPILTLYSNYLRITDYHNLHRILLSNKQIQQGTERSTTRKTQVTVPTVAANSTSMMKDNMMRLQYKLWH